MPDLTIPANVTILRSWEGDFNAVKLIKMVTLKHPDTIKQQGTEKAKRIEEESERQMAALEKRAMKGAMIDTTVLPKTMIAQSFMKNDMEIS